MPRWISLLVLCSFAFTGATASAWAEVVSDAPPLEIALEVETPSESEEEATRVVLEAVVQDEPGMTAPQALGALYVDLPVPPGPPPR
ncbi:hypothetical protein [Rubrivirga sp.]|uniref:hypothetical protein n=1 Tax=Rubrivirga sp. TaxID=1885344 RepID=UPI003C7174A2